MKDRADRTQEIKKDPELEIISVIHHPRSRKKKPPSQKLPFKIHNTLTSKKKKKSQFVKGGANFFLQTSSFRSKTSGGRIPGQVRHDAPICRVLVGGGGG